jgi:hypothetical protein
MSLPEACLTITPEQVIVETPGDAVCLVLEINHFEIPLFGRQKELKSLLDREYLSFIKTTASGIFLSFSIAR